ncbi:MAG TPA: hypothetical protein VF079_03805 [Sphingomicrobium sp.]
MRRMLLGCAAALALGGCSVGGHDAEQIVRKDPSTVYSAIDGAFSEIADQGNNGRAAEHGQVTTIERVANKSLDLTVTIEGKQAMHMRFGVEPEKGGAETRLTGDWEIDQKVLRDAVRKEGGDVAMPTLPNFVLDAAMKKLLSEMGEKIEAGEPLDTSSHSFAMTSSPQSLPTSDYERRYREQQAQRQASAPMMDPDAAARNFMGGH